MSKLLVVIGATGGQGGSVISSVLNDPKSDYKIRGITRNASSERAKTLTSKGVEMVSANLDDAESLEKAFEGANAIFAVTNFFETVTDSKTAMEAEYKQGISLVKAVAKVSTLEHFVWSSLPDTAGLTNNKVMVPHFQAKANVDKYIKEEYPDLLKKTTFSWFSVYAVDFGYYPHFIPTKMKTANKYIQLSPASPSTPIPSMGDHAVNAGIFVNAMLRDSPKNGVAVKCVVENLPMDEYLALWGRSSGLAPDPGSTFVFQIPLDQYSVVWPVWSDEIGLMLMFWDEAREKSWESTDGSKVIDVYELLTEKEKSGIVDAGSFFKTWDWSSL